MCLARGPQHSAAGEARTRGLSVSSPALYHWATALPMSPKELWEAYIEIALSVPPALCPVHISFILSGMNSKFGVWQHLGMAECLVPFSGHCDIDLDLWPIFYNHRARSYCEVLNQTWFFFICCETLHTCTAILFAIYTPCMGVI